MKKAVVVESSQAQDLRKCLQSKGFWDSTRRLQTIEDRKVAIPVTIKTEEDEEDLMLFLKEEFNNLNKDIEYVIGDIVLPPSKKSKLQSPYDKLLLSVLKLFQDKSLELTDDITKDLPNHWELHGDLVLLPGTCFKHHIWKSLEPDIWEVVKASLTCTRVARKESVSSDGFRTPRVTLLHGDNGWIQQVDNGIRFTYDVTKCMYSSGNITEKLRIANFTCEGETVVDLYAGIGYFTIPYLVHAKAKYVHACEWNPDAVEALKKNLQLNNVSDRCTVYLGDNRKVCPKGLADRVNLGLIPSSEQGWRVACVALNPLTGGVMHIHHNVTSKIELTNKESKCSEHKGHGQFSNFSNGHPFCEKGHSDDVTKHSEVSSNDVHNQNICTCFVEREYVISSSTTEFDEWKKNHNCQSSDQQEGQADCQSSGQSIPVVSSNDQFSEPISECQSVDLWEEQHGCHSSGQSDSGELSTAKSLKDIHPAINTLGIEETCMKCERKICAKSKLKQLKKQEIWSQWAQGVSETIQKLLYQLHQQHWTTHIIFIENVKSYAPHVDHLVLDLECRPCS